MPGKMQSFKQTFQLARTRCNRHANFIHLEQLKPVLHMYKPWFYHRLILAQLVNYASGSKWLKIVKFIHDGLLGVCVLSPLIY